MRTFNLSDIELTKYLFFTGKGGVGKTSIACATAVGLADNGKKILLISTDPASNLQDVFNQTLNGHGTDIQEVPGLTVVNLDPEQAAAEYRESVIAPFRGKLPDSVIQNMEEQLSGSCTVEIAAFNQFSDFITDADKAKEYDHIIFDTAPTGHTLRMLQLPSAWSTFISESTHGASCLGQLSGLEERKGIYKQAVETLSDANATRLVLVSRPEIAPLKEAARSSHELQLLGINNQLLVINGLLLQLDEADSVSKQIYDRQQTALKQTPAELLDYPSYSVPLRSYNLSNIANIRRMLYDDNLTDNADYQRITDAKGIDELVNDLYQSGKRVVFTMGKGGVGKTTLATEIALKLTKLGAKVHLTTTDPANHLNYNLAVQAGITVSRIDEAEVLEAYKNEVRSKAAETMTAEDMEYIEEDLRSPCTQEIAVFRAFAEIVDKAENEIQRSFRMNGLTLNDENILEAMDSAFPGSSDVLYGVRYSKKEGMFKGSLADEDEMEETLEFAKKIAGKTLRAIMRGRIEVSPTEYHGKTACKYCPYISICCFDTTAGCRYRRPRAVDADKFFKRENK